MSVQKLNQIWYLRIRPFKDLINVRTSAITKVEARQIESAVLVACRSGDYRNLNAKSREACLRMFQNRKWEIPEDLAPAKSVQKELTLWDAVEIFLHYPTVRDSKAKERYIYCLSHLVDHFGKDRAVKSIWVPDIREYQAKRSAKVSAGTVNWEVSTLSKLFGVLKEHKLVDENPVRLIRRLSTKDEEREVYLSDKDFREIMELCPLWYRYFAQTLYYTGMRRGEAMSLKRNQVNLHKRMIYLKAGETKEGHSKRVPIHKDLVPILEQVLKISSLENDEVFLIVDKRGVRAPSDDSIRNPWDRAVKKMDFETKPRLNDLRHTWRTNARRSGVDPQIAESIMGHWFKGKSVNDRYGRISDQELVDAMDRMTVDHGDTEILTTRKENVIKV